MKFRNFFKLATGYLPFPFQERFAVERDPPDFMRVPTGAGKTATAILGWLWRRFLAEDVIRSSTPTRMVYCLPMRVLVEQTFKNADTWLAALGFKNKVGLHVLMGGEDVEDRHLYPEREAILVGTQDVLISAALNRGYGISRYRWPIDFGLLSNDCLWVLDEVQLMGSGLAASTQLEAFRKMLGTCGVSGSMWMSATFNERWLNSVDFAKLGKTIVPLEITDEDKRQNDLGKRLKAPKQLHACEIPVSQPDELAKEIFLRHKPQSRTLVVLNTVRRATDLYNALRSSLSEKTGNQFPELVLIHSRFRPPDRKAHIERLLKEPTAGGLIAVTTQVIEAGVDVDARTLFTELAPWPSLIQRFGRCNRSGLFADAAVYWINLFNVGNQEGKTKKKADTARNKGHHEIEKNLPPYSPEELSAAASLLREMDDVSIENIENRMTSIDEPTLSKLFPYAPQHVIRRKDIIELFDTTPDLAGNDIDVSRFIREGEDLDAQVFWRNVAKEVPSSTEPLPGKDELCPVRTNQLREFAKSKPFFRWDFLDERWVKTQYHEVFPGRTYLIPLEQGGYDSSVGWDPLTISAVKIDQSIKLSNGNDADGRDERSSGRAFERLSDHTDKVCAILAEILLKLYGVLGAETVEALQSAARWHDRGKAHDIFQHAIEPDDQHHNCCWAKAPQMRKYERVGFRHELAGALAMLEEGLPDLACYLVAAHHGKVRLSIRSLPHERRPANTRLRFARGIWDGDTLPETDLGEKVKAPAVTLSLEPMELGLSPDGKPSWAERMLTLRDARELGPFRLAFLEAILRAADMRASASSVIDAKEDTHA